MNKTILITLVTFAVFSNAAKFPDCSDDFCAHWNNMLQNSFKNCQQVDSSGRIKMKLSCATGQIQKLEKFFKLKKCDNCKVTAQPIVFGQEAETVTEKPPTYDELKTQLEEALDKINLQKTEIGFYKQKLEDLKQIKENFSFQFDNAV